MVDAIEARPGTDPDRASFTSALEAARDQLTAAAGICPDDPAGQPGIIGRAVLATLLPARRPRYSARIVKCSTSRYHENDDSRPRLPAAITAIGITMHTPPIGPGAPSRARHSARTPRPDQPPTRRQRITQIMTSQPRENGPVTNSPCSWTSSPATCSPSSANGHAWDSSPAPDPAPTGSTRRPAQHPRQPPPTLNFAALPAQRRRRALTAWHARLAGIRATADAHAAQQRGHHDQAEQKHALAASYQALHDAYRQREMALAPPSWPTGGDWEHATRQQRHLAAAADAELRRCHPGQPFPPLRSAEPEPATQAQRDELTPVPGAASRRNGPVDQGPRRQAPHLRRPARGPAEPEDPVRGPRLRRPRPGLPRLDRPRPRRDPATPQARDPAIPAGPPARRRPRCRLRGRRMTAPRCILEARR
jgi:hypothetical protein